MIRKVGGCGVSAIRTVIMRPSKLILWAVCVALLAAELASAEASPPYEEVAGEAGVQGRKEGPHHSHILS